MSTRRNTKRWGPAALIVISLATGGYLWIRPGTALQETPTETGTVRRETIEQVVEATGVVRPQVGAEIDVGSRVSGIVRSLPVTVGDRVRPGDLLARIDPTELQAVLDQALADRALAEARLDSASITHARTEVLASQGIVPASELDAAAGDLRVARARLDMERARVRAAGVNLGFTEIRAPIGGVISNITTREGETVAAGFATPTFVTIVDLDRLEVQAYVDETDIGRVAVGQEATFTVESFPDRELAARVKAINPQAEIQNGVVNYVLLLQFQGREGITLRPEMTAHVRLRTERRDGVLTISRSALRRGPSGTFVLARRNGDWQEVPVRTGLRTETRIEVLGELSAGDTVRVDPG